MLDIQAQVDIGQLSVAGLGMFAPVLAAFSADDVSPMAMVQLDKLGAAFPISGPKALQVADCLQRFSSTKIERLGILIGWRRGDTASYMAKSSSGQPVALLCACLGDLFPVDYGTVLYHLSEKAVAASYAVASPFQLRAAGDPLRAKLACLGFGNVLAKNAARIHDAYKYLNVPVPSDIHEPLSVETVVHLLHSISCALRQEYCIVRVSGTVGLGYIAGLVMMLFPDDALISVANYVIHAGPRRSIILELKETQFESPPQIVMEDLLEYSNTITLPIVPQQSSTSHPPKASFRWEGWIANRLRLDFFEYGFECAEKLLLACCALILAISQDINRHVCPPTKYSSSFPQRGTLPLWGPHPRHRIVQPCQSFFQVPPFEIQHNVEEAYASLLQTFESVVPRPGSDCCTRRYDLDSFRGITCINCPFHRLWKAMGWAVDAGSLCSFIAAGPKATVESASSINNHFESLVATNLNRRFKDPLANCGRISAPYMKTLCGPFSLLKKTIHLDQILPAYLQYPIPALYILQCYGSQS